MRNRLGVALVVTAGLTLLWGSLELRASHGRDVAPTPLVVQVISPDMTATPRPTATATASLAPRATTTPTVIALPTRAPTRTPTNTLIPSATPTATTAPTNNAAVQVAGAPTRRQLPAVVMGPTVPLSERYLIGGLNMGDGNAPLSIAYPADYDSDAMTRFDGLTILSVDFDGSNYQRFVTDYSHFVFVYGDAPSGSFVLNVHDGTLRGSGRELEAEPLRRLIEGDLYAPFALDVIESNLASLLGRQWVLAQNGLEVRFRLVKAARMNAEDVAFYREQASQLSTFIGGIPDPRRSFMMFFCSGRQPGEPSGAFVGRYVLLLEAAG
jgi:hypothetical protein